MLVFLCLWQHKSKLATLIGVSSAVSISFSMTVKFVNDSLSFFVFHSSPSAETNTTQLLALPRQPEPEEPAAVTPTRGPVTHPPPELGIQPATVGPERTTASTPLEDVHKVTRHQATVAETTSEPGVARTTLPSMLLQKPGK